MTAEHLADPRAGRPGQNDEDIVVSRRKAPHLEGGTQADLVDQTVLVLVASLGRKSGDPKVAPAARPLVLVPGLETGDAGPGRGPPAVGLSPRTRGASGPLR